jgi:acetylornithine deacetylase
MDALTSLLGELVAADTHNPGGDEPALARRLGELLAARRADEVTVREVPGDRPGAWVLARWGTPRLLLNAHLDTVPPNGWTGDPYRLERRGDRLIGLGACDTKSAIAAILSALEEGPPRDVAVLFSGDEERTGTCLRDFLDSGRAAGITQAVVCEPTSLRVGVRHRGVVGLEVHRAGKGGHSSFADEMPAPVAELARLAVAYDDWGRAARKVGPPGFPGMCLNVARLEGGVAFNVVPEAATLTLSARPPPGADVARVTDELVAIAARVVPGAKVHRILEHPTLETRDPAAFRRWLGDATLAPIDLGFWTEAAMLTRAGIEAVVFGPGDIARAHAPDEWVTVEELAEARQVFARLFRRSREEGDGAR